MTLIAPPLADDLEEAEQELAELRAICQALEAAASDLANAIEALVLEDSVPPGPALQA